MLVAPVSNEKISSPKEGASGVMKGGAKEHRVAEWKGDSKGVSEFLSDANAPQEKGELSSEVMQITPEVVETEQEIGKILTELHQLAPKEEKPTQKGEKMADGSSSTSKETPKDANSMKGSSLTNRPEARTNEPKTYSSVFSMARELSKQAPQAGVQNKANGKQESLSKEHKEQTRFEINTSSFKQEIAEQAKSHKEDSRDREGRNGQGRDQQEEEGQKKQKQHIPKVEAASGKKKHSHIAGAGHAESGHAHGSRPEAMDNIFLRFMALMARILGQAEAEAHELYKRIKARTDDIDTLTTLMSKINSSNGAIDWSNNAEMKELLAKAKKIGVDIPDGKFTWTEEEKKLFKENIQMKKDSMEKITQLERTDMQRYLQEASQCHQARSNVLKLMKEVTDTIIHNMRP